VFDGLSMVPLLRRLRLGRRHGVIDWPALIRIQRGRRPTLRLSSSGLTMSERVTRHKGID